MRILLIAYEYPPVVAPQALRWLYLGNELGAFGAEVDVLTPAFRNIWRASDWKPYNRVRVNRCFPGPFVGVSGWLASKCFTVQPAEAGEPPTKRIADFAVRTYRIVRSILNHVLIPDVRTEWFPYAWKAAQYLHEKRRYDVVIASHEPGVDLLLGRGLSRRWRIPWVADLGDPLLTPYTPSWRRSLDHRLERLVCRDANAVLVTNEIVANLLSSRHGVPRDKFTIVRQGFDGRRPNAPGTKPSVLTAQSGKFILLYTGTFYRGFRDPAPLIQAVLEVSELTLLIAGDVGKFAQKFGSLGDRLVLLGRQTHTECLALQRHVDLLVSFGNTQNYQVPGKIHEYLGARRPILHIAGSPDDHGGKFLECIHRGLVVRNDRNDISETLRQLISLWKSGDLDESFDLTDERTTEFTWTVNAERLHDRLNDLL